MVPSWVLNALIIFSGCIFACFLGSTLPDYDPMFAAYILAIVIACTLCVITNNFPMLLALGTWTPFGLPIPVFKAFPTSAVVVMWMALILFFRLCLTGSLRYVRSYNLFLLICFAWVPIRFLMNPVHKFGSTVEGGSGVSGAAPYFSYVLTALLLIVLGAILNSREKVFLYLRWSLTIVLIVGIGLFICAFIPATGPLLAAMGSFQAGSMGDGIQRLVQLPGYGLFLVEAALCPDLFRLSRKQSAVIFILGMAMMIIGGNRSAVAAACLAVPVILFLRRKSHAVLFSLCVMVASVGLLRFTVNQLATNQISPLVRSFGMFDSKIDEASGGAASANWRYAVWQSGIEKIMQSPLVGKGYGNLPEHLDPTDAKKSTDFEVVLAGGEAHNGFVTAAYGFGIPFMLALTVGIFLPMIRQARLALTTDKHDRELRDLHALLACMCATYVILIYSAFDLSMGLLWTYVGMGLILDNLPKGDSSTIDVTPVIQHKLPPSNEQFKFLPTHSSR